MSTSVATFRLLAPEFDSVSDDDVGSWLELASLQHTAVAFGNMFGPAMAYFAAHLMKQSGLDDVLEIGAVDGGSTSAAGSPTSRKAGDLSIGYGAAAIATMKAKTVGDAELMETRYGRRYLQIRGTRAARSMRVIVMNPDESDV